MPADQSKFEKALNDGHSAAWDQHWEEAANYYRAALEEFPNHAGALASLGLALFELQDFDQALEVYQRASILAPKDPVAFEKMARIYERIGQLGDAVRSGMQAAELYLEAHDIDKSIEDWVRVTSLQPENMTAHTRLAVIYEKMGRKPEAVAAYLNVASLFQHRKDIAKATQVVQYALKLLPGSPDASEYMQLLKSGNNLPRPVRPRGGTGPVRMAEIRQLQSSEDTHAAVQSDPISEARQNALVQLAGLLFEQSEEIEETNDQANRHKINALARGTGGLSLDHTEQSRVLLHLGQAIESQTHNDENQALDELNRVYEVGFSHPALHFNLGYLYSSRDSAKAIRSLNKSVKNPDFSLASNLLLGKIYYDAGKYSEAAINYLQALRLADITTVPEGQKEQLRQLYEPVIEAQANQTDDPQLKSICETIAGQLIQPDWRLLLLQARQQLPILAEGAPPMPVSEILLETRSAQVIELLANIRTYESQGMDRTAMEEAFYALDYAPTYLPLHIEIGDLLAKEGKVDDAVRKYMLVTQLYNLRGDATQAINLLTRVTQIAPMDQSVRDRLIELLTEQGRIDDAIQQYMELADMFYRLAEMDRTRQTYLTAMRLAKQSARNRLWAYQILSHLADIDVQRLDWRQALRFYEQMRTLQPEDQVPRNRIVDLNFRLGQDPAAYSELDNYLDLLENSRQLNEAIAFLECLLEDYPDKSNLRRRLANVFLKASRTAEAISQLDALADAYHEAGEIRNAIQVVEEIIQLNPPDRDQFEAVLKDLRKEV